MLNSKSITFNKKKTPLFKHIKRPNTTLFSFFNPKSTLSRAALFTLETDIKYSGYVEIEKKRAKKISSLEKSKIPKDFEYSHLKNMSSESREKLSLVRPETVGQAMRIGGVSSSDISELCYFLAK